MKNTLKTLGVICIIAAAIFIAACGDLLEADFVVTFDANGGKLNGQDKVKVTVTKDSPVSNPGNPAAPSGIEPTTAGFYKLATNSTSPSFGGWTLNGQPYTFSDPVTSNITLVALWTGGSEATNLTTSLSGTGEIFNKVVTYLNLNTTSTTANDKYLLVLDADITESVAIIMTKGDLKIINSGRERYITSGYKPADSVTNKVFLTIGAATSGTNNPKLTLYNIGLKGPDAAVGDSLVRVRNGATLIMDYGSSVKGHKNSATSGNGDNGNGSAVCVYGGNLTMKEGSVIEENESTASVLNGNRNRVGGVYTYVPTGGIVNLNIEGGQIVNNKCTEGNTNDLYATENGIFNLSGKVKIDELTINADPATAAAVPATIIVSNLQNDVGKLSLRSTGAISDVKTAWLGKQVISGPNQTAPSSADLAKFTLGDFKGNPGFEPINADTYTYIYSIGTDGKLGRTNKQ